MCPRDVMTADVMTVFLEQSPAAAFLRDAAGVYLWVNRAYADLYDMTAPADMVGHDVFAFDPPLLAAVYLESDQTVLNSGAVLRHTLPLPRRDGIGEAAGHRFGVPLPGGRTGVAGIYTDVTELHQARDEARRYEAVFERSGIALALLTPAGVVRRANPAFAALVGRKSLGGTTLDELLGPDAVRVVLDDGTRTAVGVHLPDGAVRPAIACAATEPGGFDVVLALQPLPTAPEATPVHLSGKERRLVELLALGVDNAAVAGQLGLSRQGLDYHIRRLRRKLRAATRVDLVARAYATGVLDPSSWPPKATLR